MEDLFHTESKDSFDGDEFSYAKGKKRVKKAKKPKSGKVKRAIGNIARSAGAAARDTLGKQIAGRVPAKKPATPAPKPDAPAPVSHEPPAPDKKGLTTGAKVGIGAAAFAVITIIIVVATKKKKGK